MFCILTIVNLLCPTLYLLNPICVPSAHMLVGETDTEQIILRMIMSLCLVMTDPRVMQIWTASHQRSALIPDSCSPPPTCPYPRTSLHQPHGNVAHFLQDRTSGVSLKAPRQDFAVQPFAVGKVKGMKSLWYGGYKAAVQVISWMSYLLYHIFI